MFFSKKEVIIEENYNRNALRIITQHRIRLQMKLHANKQNKGYSNRGSRSFKDQL